MLSVLMTSFSAIVSRGLDLVLFTSRRVVEDFESRFLPPGDSASIDTLLGVPGVRGVIGVLGVDGILDTEENKYFNSWYLSLMV